MAGLPEKSAFAHKKKTSKKIYGIIIKKENLSNIEIVFENPCLSKLR